MRCNELSALLLIVTLGLTPGCRRNGSETVQPSNGLTASRFEPTPARLERGRYLVEAVTGCFHCHSANDWKKPGAPPLEGQKGAGTVFPMEGFTWVVVPNLTPDDRTGIGQMTDPQIARAIREGIGRDGRRLFPLMPYLNYRQMSDEDVASVVVYLRSLEPVSNPLPPMQMPREIAEHLPPVEPLNQPVVAPDRNDPIAWGRYLVTLGDCFTCHTVGVIDQGRPQPGMEFAGGMVFKGPWGSVAAANITPDPSGISYYDETLFIEAMRTGHVKARALNPLMPWAVYGKMTDGDLKAVFAFLRALPAVKHRVDNTEPVTPCARCGKDHGAGAFN